jgi:hypothetical protein
MGDTPDDPATPASSQEETGDSSKSLPQRGDHPMFWGDPDFNPLVRKKSGDDL